MKESDNFHTSDYATIEEPRLSFAEKNSSRQGDGNEINRPTNVKGAVNFLALELYGR
jgi:hypothetical protein